MANFQVDLLRGKTGEEMVAATLTNRGHQVVDVSNIKDFQQKDIDFVINLKSGAAATIEVKTDYKSEKTNRFFIETYNENNVSRNSKGWFHYCQAEFLFLVQPNNHIVYIVDWDQLKNYIQEHKNSIKYLSTNDGRCAGYCVDAAALVKTDFVSTLELVA